MRTDVDDLMRFHLLGQPIESELPGVSALLPAPLAPYRDLPALRYDYPLVLSDDPPSVDSLTDVANRAIRRVAPRGPAGERMRQHVLRLETEIRRLVASGRRSSLGELWDAATQRLLADGDDECLCDDLAEARSALAVDGRVVDCDEHVASVVVTHVWSAAQRATSSATRRRIDEQILGLSDILRSHDARSDEGRSPGRLSETLGGDDRASFDFDAWSDILRASATPATISEVRRRRIRSAVAALEAQQFFPAISTDDPDRGGTYRFLFRSCVAAAAAYRERVPAMVRLVKAMAIAELELQNGYRNECDPYFDRFDERSLSRDDLGLFPSYLVCLTDTDLAAEELAQVTRFLGSNAPIKILVEVRDVLGEPGGLPLANGSAPPAIVGRQLGRMAMGTGTAFVVQTASSHLHRVIDRIHDGLASTRPALFSVFTGSTEHVPSLAPYLVTAAAVQSRAVPTFVFDADAGPTWADRFDLGTNPDDEAAWPTGPVWFEDAEMQRRVEPTAFTPADFAALDRRYGRHFTTAPPHTWSSELHPAGEVVEAAGADQHIPYLLMTSEDGVLHRVVVDRELIQTARQYGETWRSLQELAGIHNSHAVALLAAERARWEAERAAEIGDVVVPTAPTEVDVGTGTPGVSSTEPVPASDEPSDGGAEPTPECPYIETVRCTTCDECTDINPRMFAYDDNKQAYIADPGAGTYLEMVEAAEACQVAIIHPGLPRDTSEQGLDDLIARAAAFACSAKAVLGVAVPTRRPAVVSRRRAPPMIR